MLERSSLGLLSTERNAPAVVEVPAYFCDPFLPGTGTTEPPPDPSQETVMLVVGGREEFGGDFVEEVEVFGCPGDDRFYPVEPYPILTSSAGGAFVLGDGGGGGSVDDLDHVLVCGGEEGCEDVNDPGCDVDLTQRCYAWTAEANEWSDVPWLIEPRWSHILAQVPDLDSGEVGNGAPVYPMALGYTDTTELYVSSDGAWRPYRDMPTESWRSSGCLLQHPADGNVYNVRSLVEVIDPSADTVDNTFAPAQLGDPVPSELVAQGRCADLELNGEPGGSRLIEEKGENFRKEKVVQF